MTYFGSAYDVATTFLILILTILMATKVGRLFGLNDKKGLVLFLWHSIFCFAYIIYSEKFGSDSIRYYENSALYNIGFDLGTKFILWVTAFLTQILQLSYLNCFLLFNFIGYVGLLAFAGAVQQATSNSSIKVKYLGLLIVFLPSVSFWSSALGKDAISFMATGLALWASLNFKKRLPIFLFAVIAMLMVRPHMAAVMLAAYALAFIFDRQTSILQRFIVGSTAIILSGIMIPFAMQYAGLGDAENVSDVQDYIDQRQEYNLEGGSSLDISSMSLPMQLFTYLFRPLPYEANNIFALAASLDNVILLFLVVWGVSAIIKRYKPLVGSNRAFLWLYVFMAWLIFATTTANLGIAMRQKWMLAPMLIFLLLSVIGTRKVSNEIDNNETLK